MSVSYKVYIGPYIEVRVPKTDKVKACPASDCKLYGKKSWQRFCPECGSKVEMVSVLPKEISDFDMYNETNGSLTEVILEDLNPGDVRYFIPNIVGYGLVRELFENTVSEILVSDIVSNLDAFLKSFAKPLEKIFRVFGKENVIVKWGVVSYTL